METSSAAASGSASAAVHSIKYFSSYNMLRTTMKFVDLRAVDEIRASVAASPPSLRGSGSRKKRERVFSLSIIPRLRKFRV
jgi:hypothetical protein